MDPKNLPISYMTSEGSWSTRDSQFLGCILGVLRPLFVRMPDACEALHGLCGYVCEGNPEVMEV